MFLPPHKYCLQFSTNPVSQKLSSFYTQPWSDMAGVQITQFSLIPQPPALLPQRAAVGATSLSPAAPRPHIIHVHSPQCHLLPTAAPEGDAEE